MIEREATIVNLEGLHARPAARIVRLASSFDSDIEICKDGVGVNGKSIMGVMMLAAECGSSITIRANGPDAEKAAEALAALVADGFGEAVSVPRLFRGIGVSPGVACGPALVIRWDFPAVPDRTVRADQVESEVRRLREAVEYVVSHLQELGERVLQRAGPEESRIFDAQILMAQDKEFLAAVETLIRNNQLSAETAYEFKALELQGTLVRRRPAARASGRPARHPDAHDPPVDGWYRQRALVGPRR